VIDGNRAWRFMAQAPAQDLNLILMLAQGRIHKGFADRFPGMGVTSVKPASHATGTVPREGPQKNQEK